MDDLISEFITETVESLSVLDGELINLERNPEDEAILGNIFRIMHTIKGTCGFLGLPRLESVAHASENVLGKIRDKELSATPEAVSLILESLDQIKDLIDYLSENGSEPEGDDTHLIGRLNQFAETGSAGGGEAVTVSVAAQEEVPVVDDTAHDMAEMVVEDTAGGDEGEASFPHFCGEDDPEIAAAVAALEKAEAEKAAAAAPAAPAPEPAKPAPAPKPAVASKPKEDTKPKEAASGGANNAANQSIRVNLDVLENLMQMVSELVLTRNQLMQVARTKEDKDYVTPLQQLSHITSELQDGVMKTRMQPIGNAWAKFPRLIRDLSNDLGKKIELKMIGEETELDRQLLEVIKDPLTHMVRNSCDHGLETPEQRKAAGKDEVGTVTLSAYHEGGHIVIDIIDDGRGVNIERVKDKALSSGIVTEAELAEMSEKQIAMFIFAAGFSTAEQVTSVSGRGVGMDVVRTNIEKIGGAIDLDSEWGRGSKISVKIPLTLAIVSVLLVEAGGQKFAIPQINVNEMVRVGPNTGMQLEVINDALMIRLRDKLLPIAILAHVLGMPVNAEEIYRKPHYVAVCKVGGCDFGILVDRVHNTEEIVVKPVTGLMKDISLYSGNTILGDGSVIMIIDPNGLAKTVGNVDIPDDGQEASRRAAALQEQKSHVDFLLFSLTNGAPKAVPLELVSRLEEIDVSTIECADDYPVVQYRGDLMRLITLGDDSSMPDSGNIEVIVFSYDKKVMGLVVKEILDITKAPMDIKLATQSAKQNGLLGSTIINGKTTDVIDVGSLLADFVDQAVVEANTGKPQEEVHDRLLLVEDSMFFRNLTIPFLSAAGYKVQAVEDAHKALKLLADPEQKIDLIVSDIEMPGMDGFEFADTCRKNPALEHIPIVAYTASLSSQAMDKSKAVGMRDCIIKTDRPGLLESIARCLQEVAA